MKNLTILFVVLLIGCNEDHDANVAAEGVKQIFNTCKGKATIEWHFGQWNRYLSAKCVEDKTK